MYFIDRVKAVNTDRPDLKGRALAYGQTFEASLAVEEGIVAIYAKALADLETRIETHDPAKPFGSPIDARTGEIATKLLRKRFELRDLRKKEAWYGELY